MNLFKSLASAAALLKQFGFRTKEDGAFAKRVADNINSIVRAGRIDRPTTVSLIRDEMLTMAERGLWEAYEPQALWHFCTRSELAFRSRGWEKLADGEIAGVPDFGMSSEEGNALVCGMLKFIDEAALKGASMGQVIVELAQGIAMISESGHGEISSPSVRERILRGLAPTFREHGWPAIG